MRMSRLRIAVFALLLAAPASVSAANPPATAFVNTSGTEFTLDGSVPTIWNWRSQADVNVTRFANAWVLATEQQGEERSAQMDEAFSRGTSVEIAPTALPTKGVAE
jgi:hypothetical protein